MGPKDGNGSCAAPIRLPLVTDLSLAGCSPAEPASVQAGKANMPPGNPHVRLNAVLYKPPHLKRGSLHLDNGAFHKTKHLRWPVNIRPLFLPPYSPELNPAEKIWWRFKRAVTNKTIQTLDQCSEFIAQQVRSLSAAAVQSICNFPYFQPARSLWVIL